MAVPCVLLILFSALKTNFQKLEKCLLFRRISEQVYLKKKTTRNGFVIEAFHSKKQQSRCVYFDCVLTGFLSGPTIVALIT